MANEAFALVKIDDLPKDADRMLTDDRSVRFGHPLGGDGKANYVLYGCRGSAVTTRYREVGG